MNFRQRITALAPRDLVVAALLGIGWGGFMVLGDASVFRAAVPAGEAAMLHGFAVLPRVLGYMPMVLADELVYRLIVVGALAWLLMRLVPPARRDNACWPWVVAIMFAALLAYPLGHLAYLRGLPPGGLTVARELIEHGGAGLLWGWLYWRKGLPAAIVGHLLARSTVEVLLAMVM